MLAGVAGGTAKYLGVDPTFVRLGFAARRCSAGIGAARLPGDGRRRPRGRRQRQARSCRQAPTWAIVLLAIAPWSFCPARSSASGDGPWFLRLRRVLALARWSWSARWPTGPGAASGPAGEAAPQRPARAGGLHSSAAKPQRPPRLGGHHRGSSIPGDGTGQRIVRLLAIVLLAFCAFCRRSRSPGSGRSLRATGNGEIVAGVVVALGSSWPAAPWSADAFRRAARGCSAWRCCWPCPRVPWPPADVRFDGGVGEQTHTPVSAAEIPDDGYELGVGQMKVDLRQLDFGAARRSTCRPSLGPRPADRPGPLRRLRDRARPRPRAASCWSAASPTRGRARSRARRRAGVDLPTSTSTLSCSSASSW